jgi:uncharacterized protein (TIGR02598 family)
LVEVVLALGILSFAVVPILAMITGSLQTYRSALNDMVGRQILTELAANAQQSRADDLLGVTVPPMYFDAEGQPVDSMAGSVRVYTANMSASVGANPLGSGNLIRVQIRVDGLAVGDRHETSVLVFPQS